MRGDVVVIEHRQAFEHVLVDGHGVDVVADAVALTSAAALLTVISCCEVGECRARAAARPAARVPTRSACRRRT